MKHQFKSNEKVRVKATGKEVTITELAPPFEEEKRTVVKKIGDNTILDVQQDEQPMYMTSDGERYLEYELERI